LDIQTPEPVRRIRRLASEIALDGERYTGEYAILLASLPRNLTIVSGVGAAIVRAESGSRESPIKRTQSFGPEIPGWRASS